jgi:hypothetical protein
MRVLSQVRLDHPPVRGTLDLHRGELDQLQIAKRRDEELLMISGPSAARRAT